MSNEDWIEKLLREALNHDPQERDFTEFEQECHAIKEGIRERKGRAIICAAAALAVGTDSLRVACHLPAIPEEESQDTLRAMLKFLAQVLSRDEFTFIPAAIAGILLRKAYDDERGK